MMVNYFNDLAISDECIVYEALTAKVRSQKKNDIIWEFFPNVGPPPPTVGQDVVELICQSERKTQQNATFYL